MTASWRPAKKSVQRHNDRSVPAVLEGEVWARDADGEDVLARAVDLVSLIVVSLQAAEEVGLEALVVALILLGCQVCNPTALWPVVHPEDLRGLLLELSVSLILVHRANNVRQRHTGIRPQVGPAHEVEIDPKCRAQLEVGRLPCRQCTITIRQISSMLQSDSMID